MYIQINGKEASPQKKNPKAVKYRAGGADLQNIHELDIVQLFQRFFAKFVNISPKFWIHEFQVECAHQKRL